MAMARTGGRRGEVGRTEILVGLAVLAVLVLITVPLIWSMARRSRREEVAENVEAIRQRELENMRTFSEYLAADAAPNPWFDPSYVTDNWDTIVGHLGQHVVLHLPREDRPEDAARQEPPGGRSVVLGDAPLNVS